jgi:hypothetical protein
MQVNPDSTEQEKPFNPKKLDYIKMNSVLPNRSDRRRFQHVRAHRCDAGNRSKAR